MKEGCTHQRSIISALGVALGSTHRNWRWIIGFRICSGAVSHETLPGKTYNIQTLSTLSVVVKQVSRMRSMRKPKETPEKNQDLASACFESAGQINLQKWKKSC
jgi:hypothetical protein